MSSNRPTSKSPPHHQTGDISSIQEQASIEGGVVFEGGGVFKGRGVFPCHKDNSTSVQWSGGGDDAIGVDGLVGGVSKGCHTAERSGSSCAVGCCNAKMSGSPSFN
eukprot:9996526-Ditylum_brightwellii.AAC.1